MKRHSSRSIRILSVLVGVVLPLAASAQSTNETSSPDSDCGQSGFTDLTPYGKSPDWRSPENCGPVLLTNHPSGPISARTLRHQPQKAALFEFRRGVQAWRTGRTDDALRHLGEAARLDPEFVDAPAELGVVYSKTGQPGRALEQFNRAIILEPNSAPLYSNKASVLVMLSRPDEAERIARKALQLAPASVEANYMLGMSLLMQNKLTREARTTLAVAAPKYPHARSALAALEEYLAGGIE